MDLLAVVADVGRSILKRIGEKVTDHFFDKRIERAKAAKECVAGSGVELSRSVTTVMRLALPGREDLPGSAPVLQSALIDLERLRRSDLSLREREKLLEMARGKIAESLYLADLEAFEGVSSTFLYVATSGALGDYASADAVISNALNAVNLSNRLEFLATSTNLGLKSLDRIHSTGLLQVAMTSSSKVGKINPTGEEVIWNRLYGTDARRYSLFTKADGPLNSSSGFRLNGSPGMSLALVNGVYRYTGPELTVPIELV